METIAATNPYLEAVQKYLRESGVKPRYAPTATGAQQMGATPTGLGAQNVLNTALKTYMMKQAAAKAAGLGANAAGGGAAGEGVLAGAGSVGEVGATQAAAPTILGNAGAMGIGPLAAIAGATYLGGKAGYDMLQGKKADLPGRVILGMATGGLSEVANASGLFGSKERFKDEYNRAQKLRDAGINWNFNADAPTSGRSRDSLIADALSTGGNVDFARTRDENLLGGKDLVGYSFLPETFGAAYANAGLDKQIAAAQMAADAKAVREHHGTVDWNGGFNDDLKSKIAAFLAGPSPASAARSQTLSPGIGKDGKRIVY